MTTTMPLYTHTAYDLDDPRKVRLRRVRREVYDDHFETKHNSSITRRLLALAAGHSADLEEAIELMEEVEALRASSRRAERDLRA